MATYVRLPRMVLNNNALSNEFPVLSLVRTLQLTLDYIFERISTGSIAN